jgi:hypothetical protein
VQPAVCFLDHVPDRRRAMAVVTRFGRHLLDNGMIALTPGVPGRVHTPLDDAPLPNSVCRMLFYESVIEAHLDHLA